MVFNTGNPSCYYMIWALVSRYWNTTIPLRYCATNARSDVNCLITDVANNNTVIRAYGDRDRLTYDMCDAVDNYLKASLSCDRLLRRWLLNRILFLWSFVTTSTYLVGLLNAHWLGTGTLGLCLTNLLMIECLLEPLLDVATGAQMEFISLARIYEYLQIPQERAMRNKGDTKFRSFTTKIDRADLGRLTMDSGGVVTRVFRDGIPLLQACPDGIALLASTTSDSYTISDICPSSEELKETTDWHRIIGVNNSVRDSEAMARELCCGVGREVLIDVMSGWLADGAHVDIQNLRAGYADIPRDVLKGVSLTIEAKSKMGIVGTTGCGKSTLLLVLLRIIEPRSGRVLLNGIDTRELGLATLRRTLGLVPQDPILFSGTLRHNLDPFDCYTDDRIWRAISLVHLTERVQEWSVQLNHMMAEDGGNLSFGERQLLCIGRMVLRQPPLLLLDEATSAIDPRTQEAVQKTISTSFPSSTLVAIAHRLETIVDFDSVCVMERGEVVQHGSVKEVSQQKGGQLWKMMEAKRALTVEVALP